MNETEVLEQAARIVYERPDTHGDREDSFGTIAELWSGYLGAAGLPVTDYDVANMMVLLKVARSAEGVYHEDNFVDMAGYAENAAALHKAESE